MLSRVNDIFLSRPLIGVENSRSPIRDAHVIVSSGILNKSLLESSSSLSQYDIPLRVSRVSKTAYTSAAVIAITSMPQAVFPTIEQHRVGLYTPRSRLSLRKNFPYPRFESRDTRNRAQSTKRELAGSVPMRRGRISDRITRTLYINYKRNC